MKLEPVPKKQRLTALFKQALNKSCLYCDEECESRGRFIPNVILNTINLYSDNPKYIHIIRKNLSDNSYGYCVHDIKTTKYVFYVITDKLNLLYNKSFIEENLRSHLQDGIKFNYDIEGVFITSFEPIKKVIPLVKYSI